jgi:hypothetical protein
MIAGRNGQTTLTLDMQRIEQDQARGAAVANALAAWQRQRAPRRLNCMTNYVGTFAYTNCY